MMMMFQRWCWWLPFAAMVAGQYRNGPLVRWTYSLNSGMQKGNAVTSWKDRVFATTQDGRLHFVKEGTQFTPLPMAGFTTSCTSGIESVTSTDNNLEYLLYSVTDTAGTNVNSRVLAVNGIDASLRWNITLPGTAIGTPYLGSNGKIYVVHNIQDTGSGKGFVSVIATNGDTATLVDTVSSNQNLGPFGPATGRTISQGANTIDVLVFGLSIQNGFSAQGGLYMMVAENDTYEIRLASQSARSTVGKPAVSADATAVYLGQQAARISGWNRQQSLGSIIQQGPGNVNPAWTLVQFIGTVDPSSPIPTGLVLSPDESLVFTTSPEPRIFSINTNRGNTAWSATTTATHSADPKYWQTNGQNDVVYFIDMNGTVRQYVATTGQLLWQYGCADVTGSANCQTTVEADFAVLESGNLLIYGDTSGNLVALDVATFPTPAPTLSPSSSPTIAPSATPTVTQTPTGSPTKTPKIPFKTAAPSFAPSITDNKSSGNGLETTGSSGSSSGNTLALALGVVCAALFVLVCAGFYVKRRNNVKQEVKGHLHDIEAREKWAKEKSDYEMACVEAEAETLNEIIKETSPERKKWRNKGRRRSDSHASSGNNSNNLGSISEAPDEMNDTFGDMDESTYAGSEVGYELSLEAKGSAKKNKSKYSRDLLENYSTSIEPTASISPPSSPTPLYMSSPPINSGASYQDEVSHGNKWRDGFDEESIEAEPGRIMLDNANDGGLHQQSDGDFDDEPGVIRSGERRQMNFQARMLDAETPDDLLSMDGSIYIDEGNTVVTPIPNYGGYEASLSPSASTYDHPDDESLKSKKSKGFFSGPPTLPSLLGAKREYETDRNDNMELFASQIAPVRVPEVHTQERRSKSQNSSKGKSDYSKTRRPRAGMFTRANEQINLRDRSAKESNNQNTSRDDISTAATGFFSSIMTEMSKAEQQFFNPQQSNIRPQRTASPPPSPPAPPRAESSEDSSYISDGPIPPPPRSL